jgi:hypothetical protein
MGIDTDLLAKPFAEAMGNFLKDTTHLVILIVDKGLKIKEYNAAFVSLVKNSEDAAGRCILDLLLPEGNGSELFDPSLPEQSRRLKFVSPTGMPLSMNCHIFRTGEDFLIIGDHLILTDDQIFDKMTNLSNELINMTRELHQKNKALEEANENIKTMGGIIPICSYCKGIRDDKGYWNQLEKYLIEHSDALLSHGICPDCMKKYYPDDVEES